MRSSRLVLVLALVVPVAPAAAQDLKAEEAAIRALIRSSENGKPLPQVQDRVFWSGAYKTPVMGDERAVEVSRDRAPSNRVPGTTRNRPTVRKLEIAASGDMAWEFSTSELSFDLKDGTKVTLPTSTLRVWRKEQGAWKVAAVFNHPHAE